MTSKVGKGETFRRFIRQFLSGQMVNQLISPAENVFKQIRYSRGRIGADLLLLLTDNEEQTISCLFSDILINIKRDALSKRHCL